MAKEKHATPYAMHMDNDLLLYVDRTIERDLPLQGPSFMNATGPGKDGLTVISSSLVPDWRC
ncbi:hypothetical protein F1880_000936 [Penicillium rolfsii]|nr:hypothetical protein F1880_000936 [Penicillium rolfsii]